jgi:hypothetical protein
MCIRHVAEQEARIARQEVLIERLREGRSAILDDAMSLLAQMHDFLDIMRAHVAQLCGYQHGLYAAEKRGERHGDAKVTDWRFALSDRPLDSIDLDKVKQGTPNDPFYEKVAKRHLDYSDDGLARFLRVEHHDDGGMTVTVNRRGQ